jgi:phage-related protein
MAFWARSFIWDDTPSEIYDMRVFRFDGGGKDSSPAGGDIQIIKKDAPRRSKPYFYGVIQNEVLSFPLVFGGYNAIDAATRNTVEKWLFGQTTYNKLQIVQYELMGVYYNCFLTNPQIVSVGNLAYAYECTAICDSPWAWEFEKTQTHTYAGDSVNDSFVFTNDSANMDYLYPDIVFSTNALGNSITITNETDSNRQFIFTAISPSETITVDNERQIITSDTGLRRLAKFNLKWFRYLPGNNTITITGGVSSVAFTYQFASRAGG